MTVNRTVQRAQRVIDGHRRGLEAFGGSADGVDFTGNDDYALAQAVLELADDVAFALVAIEGALDCDRCDLCDAAAEELREAHARLKAAVS